jgi:hypothetical protein
MADRDRRPDRRGVDARREHSDHPMKLLLSDDALGPRRLVAAAGLHPLAASLANDLEPLLSRELYFPAEKALLSREGGRCSLDGTLLDFDPFQPHEHRCPQCGTAYRGELHDRFWIYWYQLWLAERAVHAAALSALGIDNRFAPLAEAILTGYAERYVAYPNTDNVLGPTHLFFSTYLESIWLLQVCVAVDLLDRRAPALGAHVREQVIEPSRAIIGEFDEGRSNRQVWNAVALLAAARLLDDAQGVHRAVYGPSGIVSHLADGLLADGTWFEGENYHLFAHRGLWYGVTMAEQAGLELSSDLLERFQRGFSGPFATALPDFTLPSRRDSQYAISLRQWRIAEHCELGLARRPDSTLIGALARLYCDEVLRRVTGRNTSSADVERNASPSALSRADLSWRALLCALPELPDLRSMPLESALLDVQGIAVFRRDAGRTYAALDYGHSGGGHGHPDRLNLLLAVDDTRWLDDFGTGSYVDRSLHWYRSTLAHNAPLVNGQSQRPVHGTLAAYDERDAAGWVEASAEIGPGTMATRTIVVMPGYLVDQLSWESRGSISVDLPVHANLEIVEGATAPVDAALSGGRGLEDGFAFTRDASVQIAAPGATVFAQAVANGLHAHVWAVSREACEWWRAVAPGPPAHGEAVFRVLRSRGPSGMQRMVWSWADAVASVDFAAADVIRIRLADGTTHEHQRVSDGWSIVLASGAARSSIDLGGVREPPTEPALESPIVGVETPPSIVLATGGEAVLLPMGEHEYRRSEQSWSEAGRPSAVVALAWTGSALGVDIRVPKSDLTFAQPDAVNRYDNESADVNGDGVQLYLRTDEGSSGWMLVPSIDSTDVRANLIDGWTTPQPLSARWAPDGAGYRLHVDLAPASVPLALDVVVNEMPRSRERRRGQLVLSGAFGEFVYLRGDRHEAERLIPLRIIDV